MQVLIKTQNVNCSRHQFAKDLLSFIIVGTVYFLVRCISQQTKHLYNICTMLAQRLRRWADIVQMLYKCFVFAWILVAYIMVVKFYFN